NALKNVLKTLGALLAWSIGYGSLNCFAMSGNLLGSGVGGLLGLAPYPPLFKCPYFDASPFESIY
ncbi:hypothetical protein, partial [Pseudomonas aeruginosa]|uniref:hypothetical protein n=1 Tax=Pseudomonas aeruginosa TaxID=287 RepID=UPI0030142D97